MEVKNLRLDFLVAKALAPQENLNANKRAQGSFDSFLAAAGERQTRQDLPPENHRVESPKTDKATKHHEMAKTEEPTEYETVLLAYGEMEMGYEVAEVAVQVYEAALYYITDALELTEPELVQWLADENLTLYELEEPRNLPKFVEYVLGEAEPAEILTDPKLPQVYKALRETMEILKEPEKVPILKEVAVVIKEAPKGNTPIIRAEIENLEAKKVDGEIVVTEVKAAETSNVRDIRQQSSTQALPEQAVNPERPELPPITNPASNEAVATVHTAGQNMQQALELPQTIQNTPTAQTGPPVNAQDVINQIMTQVKVSYTGQNFTEIRMTLRPESLGEIVLRVMTQNGIVMAQFEAENQRVKEALEASFNQLRDALSEAGVAFGELNVYVRHEGEDRMHQFEREARAARRRVEELQTEEIPDTKDPLHTGVLDEVA